MEIFSSYVCLPKGILDIHSLTWNKAIWGWFPLWKLTILATSGNEPVRSPNNTYMIIYACPTKSCSIPLYPILIPSWSHKIPINFPQLCWSRPVLLVVYLFISPFTSYKSPIFASPIGSPKKNPQKILGETPRKICACKAWIEETQDGPKANVWVVVRAPIALKGLLRAPWTNWTHQCPTVYHLSS